MQKFTSLIKKVKSEYNISILLIPLLVVLIITTVLLAAPQGALGALEKARTFLTQELGIFYLIYGIAFMIIAGVLAFSKIGKIRLGRKDEKSISTFSWGALIFTSTMAADILFYALHEWAYYYSLQPLDTVGSNADQAIQWASSYPLFHWGVIPWTFYLVPAVAYAFMFYVRKSRRSQRISEACRPLLGNYTDKVPGKVIDIVAIIGLLLATSTTFSVATPLISSAFCSLAGISPTPLITIIVLLVIATIYTLACLGGLKAINAISKISVIIVSLLLAMFFCLGGPKFIMESGLEGLGYMFSNLFRMATWTDPARATNIPQDWTIFYWSYWIAWAIATPLFIAKISKGRTIQQLILGGLGAGLLGTFTSFIILGGTGLHLQVSGGLDIAGMIASGTPAAEAIVKIISTLPGHEVLLVLVIVSMILLYSTTLDTISHTMASYMTKKLDIDEEPNKIVKLIWSLLFIILPIALIFSESTTQGLQAMSIIAALPLSIIFILVVVSFFKSFNRKKFMELISHQIEEDKKDGINVEPSDGSIVKGEKENPKLS